MGLRVMSFPSAYFKLATPFHSQLAVRHWRDGQTRHQSSRHNA